ncbi:MAG: hypothetical protein KBA58_04230 [Methanomassiliicoccales archaeon]|nr:hypothetical protein [Methanomassiliicoccales archaeon]
MELDLDPSDFWNVCNHGLGLSILMFLLIIGWTLVLGILVVLGFIIGLFVGLGLLALGLGYINSYLAEAIWEMKTDYRPISRFVHGVLLLIVLFITNIPIIAVTYYFPHWYIAVILFIVYIPIQGFVGIKVAEVYEVVSYEGEEPTCWGD